MSKCVQFILKKSKGPILGTFDVWYKESESIIPPKVVCFSYVTIWKSLGGSLQPKYDKGGLGSQLKAKSLYFKSCIRYTLVFNHALLQIHISDSALLTVDGGWSSWADSNSCSVTCGSGSIFRLRTCTNPTPQNGGKTCEGLPFERHTCNEGPCPGTLRLFHLSCEIMSFWMTVIKRNFLLDTI